MCFRIFVWLLSSLLFMVPFVMFCFIVCDPVSFCVLSFLAIKQIFCKTVEVHSRVLQEEHTLVQQDRFYIKSLMW